MKNSALKNVIWAMSIIVCLIAVIVGLLIASVNRYNGSGFDKEVDLHMKNSSASGVVQLTAGDMPDGASLKSLGETADAGMEYIDKLTFLCDSSVIGMRDYGLLSGGKDTYQVWGTNSGTLKISEITSTDIKYPSDGSLISIADSAMIAKPPILVICVGQDGLAGSDENNFKTNYTMLINSIMSGSPDTQIICCSISSVTENYTGPDGLTAELIRSANKWIEEVCMSTGVYYCNAAHSVDNGYGYVHGTFLSTNGKTLNSTGISEFISYLRTHALGGI
ncbi:MAG: SGNH/GDSL hydrolase family protein [Eubacteriales bacterium]|nr:SGNH/GDSL hydrolase family protein [Eubacteriales bacterium]